MPPQISGAVDDRIKSARVHMLAFAPLSSPGLDRATQHYETP
ncbi:hypothetical protein ACVWY3_002746 [Bradyrhizobium sp. USDA 4486]